MSDREVRELLSRVKLLVMDVDGTLTDGKVYYSVRGEELKVFSIRDGMGIGLMNIAALPTAIITSEDTEIVTARAKKLNIQHVILGSRDKEKDLRSLAAKLNIELQEIAYIGDDINDIPALQISGIAACPNNAVESVKSICNFIAKSDGGNGAVRELIEAILLSKNLSIYLPDNW